MVERALDLRVGGKKKKKESEESGLGPSSATDLKALDNHQPL